MNTLFISRGSQGTGHPALKAHQIRQGARRKKPSDLFVTMLIYDNSRSATGSMQVLQAEGG
jgi:hypothetical protein